MSRFLVLSNIVINTAHITRIIHNKTGYDIHFVNNEIVGRWIFASGGLWSESDILRVHNNTSPNYLEKDYNAVTEWIKSCNDTK